MTSDDTGHPPRLDDFAVRRPLTTRWSDVDMYGHVNNAVYYAYFDTAINGWLAECPDLDLAAPQAQGVVAESRCRFLRPLRFPDRLVVGLTVARLGRSSVTYRLGVFTPDDEGAGAAALGDWVHVYVDPGTGRPVPVPDGLRAHLSGGVG